MGSFIESLFNPGGAAKKAAAKAAAQQAEQNRLTLARQEQTVQNQEQDTAGTMAAMAKAPRGRRLLMGDSAPAGASATLG